ncbi:Hemolysin-type calcium-binding repeat-containing protein [Devosia crocina]|uniref:Hemolysin-type calcium-binding repeat-containing protein n=1 Tax=Devosia crocina TaxID=429728 RepID=A0A1I7NEC2_9HYPH|nr:DUF4214 domain-containing protein [Devosia crocina]SFV33014.1 Hemolysin-type calcium-binding repeat-containing protein [Devosia crocina]
MARITASSSFNNVDPSSHYGYISRATDNQYVVYDNTGTGAYGGYGLGYDGVLNVTRGTFTSYSDYRANGSLAGTVDGFAISASQAQFYASRNDMAGFYRDIMRGNDTIYGSPYDDRLAGYDGNDIIYGGGGNDYIDGGAGNDIIYVGRGTAYVTGGPGFDYVVLPGAGGSYGKSAVPEGWQFSSSFNGVTARLNSVERVQFDDGVLAFDTAGNAGQMYRLYQATYGREPDPEGLGYWIERMDAGVSLTAIADSFVYGAPEFAQRYGNPYTVSNATYVDLLYINTLGRGYDINGFNYWVNKLNTNQTNRSDLLAFFSESDENKAQVAGEIYDGIWYT